jgi:hypothetical protein
MKKMRALPINPEVITPQTLLIGKLSTLEGGRRAFIYLNAKRASRQRPDSSMTATACPLGSLMTLEHFLSQIRQSGELAFVMADFLKFQSQGVV